MRHAALSPKPPPPSSPFPTRSSPTRTAISPSPAASTTFAPTAASSGPTSTLPATRTPLLIFAAIDWTTENRTPDDPASTYTLWLFPNQPLSPIATDPNRIPPAFLTSLHRWTAQPSSGTKTIQHITTTVLVDPDGTPHELPQEKQP